MTPTARAADRLDPAVLKLAAVLVLGALAPLLDSTIVNVAIHTLGAQLQAGVATLQWVSTAYLLALAVVIPVTAWASTRFGAKRLWIVALALFLLGSVLSGLAWNAGALIAFRILQGVGAGLMLPTLQTLLMRAADREQLGRLMAVVTVPALVGPILGPAVGGLLVSHLGWRSIFYVNIPICLAAIALAIRVLPADEPAAVRRLDLTGLFLMSSGVAALLYGLTRTGPDGGFAHLDVLVPAIVGTALLIAYVARKPQQPLIDLNLFRTRSFAASTALLFLTGAALYGAMFLLPLFYQQARGASVVAAGLLLVPQGLGSLLARAAGGLSDRLGPRPVVLAGVTLTVIGTLPFAIPGTAYWVLAIGLVVRGAGLSAVNLSVMVGAFRDLRPEQIPDASSMTRIVQQLGGAVGAAALAVILQTWLAGHSPASAYAGSFAWAIAFTALAAVPALALPRRIRAA
ncbi:DHA2 family efflux MFS transporter permease subunit [Kribbella sp. NPDC056951]|uniref:DHA2 family efflux MFS transporter permease subunit n=1 Tax=Kribbella sp. NPDC056951 TaxID=3345978 RepID=UPI00362923CB